MSDSFYNGLQGSFFPCIVHEVADNGMRRCEIFEDAERVQFWVPAMYVHPLRGKEETRYDWQPGQQVEVGFRMYDIHEPKGYWSAIIVRKVDERNFQIRWSGKYNDGHMPIFHADAIRSPTILY